MMESRGWALPLALVVLVSLGGCASRMPEMPEMPEPASLAYEGVYRAAPASADEEYWYYLRFYPDQTVIAVSTTGELDQVKRWFSRDNEVLARGTYRLKGNQLSFESESDYGVVEYEGTVEGGGERLQLNSHSHINGFRASRTYHFHRW